MLECGGSSGNSAKVVVGVDDESGEDADDRRRAWALPGDSQNCCQADTQY